MCFYLLGGPCPLLSARKQQVLRTSARRALSTGKQKTAPPLPSQEPGAGWAVRGVKQGDGRLSVCAGRHPGQEQKPAPGGCAEAQAGSSLLLPASPHFPLREQSGTGDSQRGTPPILLRAPILWPLWGACSLRIPASSHSISVTSEAFNCTSRVICPEEI